MGGRRFRVAYPVIAMAVCLTALAFPAAGQGQDNCFSLLMTGTIGEVSPHGDVILTSGQRFGIADIALPTSDPWRREALTFLQNLKGQPTTVDFGGKPDRWNRSRAALAMPDGDLAEILTGKGLAVVDPGEAAALCNAELLAVERKARNERTGLWADSASHPIQARDADALLKRQGLFTLVSGRIVSVGVRNKWTYLNFGRDWKNDFSASIAAPLWQKMTQKGMSADTLRGKIVLIRGIIRRWNGPSMELSAPESLEIY